MDDDVVEEVVDEIDDLLRIRSLRLVPLATLALSLKTPLLEEAPPASPIVPALALLAASVESAFITEGSSKDHSRSALSGHVLVYAVRADRAAARTIGSLSETRERMIDSITAEDFSMPAPWWLSRARQSVTAALRRFVAGFLDLMRSSSRSKQGLVTRQCWHTRRKHESACCTMTVTCIVNSLQSAGNIVSMTRSS